MTLTVFYDGDCPVCRLEVDIYRRAGGGIAWVDIERLRNSELPAGKTREELLGRFHAQRADGTYAVGVDAFQAIWRALPGWRRAAWAFDVPGLRGFAEVAYRGFLRWQRWDRGRRKRKRSKRVGGTGSPAK